MTYQFIAVAQSEYPMTRLSDILEVSVSGYYAWRRRPQSQHTREDGELRQAIEDVYKASQQRYGSPRGLCRAPSARISLLTQACGQAHERTEPLCTPKMPSRPDDPSRSDASQGGKCPGSRLSRNLSQSKVGSGCDDVPNAGGPLFLAGVLDLFSRSLVGWALASEQDTVLVEKALRMALLRRHPADGLLHHSDRGSQYTSKNYRDLVEREGMIVSMSRTGNCYDNAAMESFWSTVKWECLSRTSSHLRVRGNVLQSRASSFFFRISESFSL